MNVFGSATNKANLWLKDVAEELGAENPREAYGAARAVLHALRDVLPTDENSQFAAQLPLIIRGIYRGELRVRKSALRSHAFGGQYKYGLVQLRIMPQI